MATDLSDVYAYIVIFGVFFLMLRQLLRFARKNIDREFPELIPDDFHKSYGYSFDYCIMFRVHEDEDSDDPDAGLTNAERTWKFGDILERLDHAGIETKQFFSCQRDEIYVKIRAKPERLRAEASRINYRLQLDPDRLRQKCNVGKKTTKGYVWKPIRYIEDKRFSMTRISPFNFIYAAYESEPYREDMYRKYEMDFGHLHVFRPVDRINLIVSILQAKRDTQGGAELNIALMLKQKALLAAFPLHDYSQLKLLQQRWLNLCGMPWRQPLDEVMSYFGERIGLYFLYLQHYVTFLMVPAFVGAVAYIAEKALATQEYVFMPIFATFMMFWTSYFHIIWRKKQSNAAMRWGTSGIEDEEQDRPLFEGEKIKSPIDAQEFMYFPSAEKFNRETRALSLVATLIITVVAIVVGIYWFQFWLGQPVRAKNLILGGINFAAIIGSLMNSVVIVSLNLIYQNIAIFLNDYENHRTDTEYEDYLISKIFLFQMVNSFAGLTYVSFVKDFLDIDCVNPTCTGDVASALSTIFLSALVSRAILEIFVRKIDQERTFARETAGTIPGIYPGIVEEQYILADYNDMTGTLKDYAGLVVQFGYTILFVAAFPLAPTIAFVSSFIQIRIDGWKLCQAYRRPQPRVAEDIGVWEDMLRLLSYVGVIYNFGLIYFTGSYFKNVTWEYRWIAFILTEHACLLAKYTWEESMPAASDETEIQLARQEFLVAKVIRNQADEVDNTFVVSATKSAFVLRDQDDDWRYVSPAEALRRREMQQELRTRSSTSNGGLIGGMGMKAEWGYFEVDNVAEESRMNSSERGRDGEEDKER